MDFSDIEVLVGSGTIDSFIGEKIVGRAMAGSQVPFYVCDLDEVCEKHLRWRNLLPRATPFYAVKCNDTPAVLRTLAALGTGFDCASKREMELVLSLGVSPDRIIYAHTTKPASHLRHARASGVDTMTFDCEDELDKIATFHPKVVDRSEPMFQAVVWGPTCAAVDRLQDALLPKLRVGDWLLSDDMGAYTVVMATHFNGFEKAEVYAVLSAQGWEKLKFCESFKDSAHVE
ncbi:ornithine decarboxylase-like [Eucyclogobius newberryi]|uniref:ornithine decarboxylase-like n=1 Tax=Eucyclogobius newberryi TaxID=166745 RepID=UPI003B5AC5B7